MPSLQFMLEDPAHWIQRLGTLAGAHCQKGLGAYPSQQQGLLQKACPTRLCLRRMSAAANPTSQFLCPPSTTARCCEEGCRGQPKRLLLCFLPARVSFPMRHAAARHSLAALSSPRRAAMLRRVCAHIYPSGSRQSEPSVSSTCYRRETSLQHHTPMSFFVRAETRSAVDQRDMRTALALTAHRPPKGCDPAHAERAHSALAANCWDMRISNAHMQRAHAQQH